MATPPTPYLFPLNARFGVDNLVLHARGRRHIVNSFHGPLSIKTVINGSVAWRVQNRDLTVDPASFLVLNDGEPYSMDINAPRPVETACLFFQRAYVETIAADATTPYATALDNPAPKPADLASIFRLHADPTGTIIHRVQTLARRCTTELQPSSFEEDFLLLAAGLLTLARELRSQLTRIPSAKASTRAELYRRLEIAREYMHGTATPVSLDSTARAACLSRYHFHQAFTKVYRQTPHAYFTTLRLARAHALLLNGATVEQTCFDLGFASPSSFTRLFRTRYAITPGSLRRNN